MRYYNFIFCLLIFNLNLSAQSPYPFGAFTVSELEKPEYEKDKDAAAVYLFDWGEAKIDATKDKALTVIKHFAIKILKPEGLQYASLKLRYSNPKIPDFKACTYNLEDGKIIESPVTKKDLFIENKSNGYGISFAFNNVKVGSIIECTYALNFESIFQLYPWSFQHDIPVAYSEFNAIFPQFFQYKYILQSSKLPITYSRSDKDMWFYSNKTSEVSLKFKGYDLPAFEPEPYMASENDQLARVEFELSKINISSYSRNVTPTYSEISEELLKDEDFGKPLSKTGFLKKTALNLTQGLTDDIEKIKVIRKYIADNVKWNEETGIYTTSPNLRKILRFQNGSAADINLLLIGMLKNAGISAHPVILSTRENGKLNTYFAVITQFDYVVAYVRSENKDYLIDATDAARPYNQLPFACLNGNGWIIHEKAANWIPLKNKEQIFDQVILNMNIGIDESLQGSVKRIFESYSAYNIRKSIKAIGTEGYLEMLKQNHGNWEYNNIQIENMDSIDKPVVIKYDIKTNDAIQQIDDLCIINPVMLFNRSENPFSNAERKYPVDFGCSEDEIYSFNFIIPDGYTVDEVPANSIIKLQENAATFMYQVNKNEKVLNIMYRYKRNQTQFIQDDYKDLREFFSKMIKKQSELIILKKTGNPATADIN